MSTTHDVVPKVVNIEVMTVTIMLSTFFTISFFMVLGFLGVNNSTSSTIPQRCSHGV